ncbi:MAG: hypothetical protein WCT26_04055 [Candidatus Buchananbacteria bacterium]
MPIEHSINQVLRYEPSNDQEERDLLLAKMIFDRENHVSDLEIEINAAKFALKKLDLEREVHRDLMAGINQERQAEWQYNFSEDFYLMERQDLERLQDEAAYDAKWLEAARKLIKTEKYLSVPSGFFRNYHFDYDGNPSLDGCCEDEIDEIPF